MKDFAMGAVIFLANVANIDGVCYFPSNIQQISIISLRKAWISMIFIVTANKNEGFRHGRRDFPCNCTEFIDFRDFPYNT